ncbi:MAG: hypothetical protein V3U84_03970 [Thiotrichaceae bacterium]
MAGCYALQQKRAPSNEVLIFVPIACPSATGQATYIQLEGQRDTNMSLSNGTVSVRDKGSGSSDEHLYTFTTGTMSVTGGVYRRDFAPGQVNMLSDFLNLKEIGIQYQVATAVEGGSDGTTIFSRALITTHNINGSLDDGDAKFTINLQLTGEISTDANVIEVVV